jgi:hypothetical protein
VDRRAFLGAVAINLVAGPLRVEGVSAGKIPRIGFLLNGNRGSVSPERTAFLEGLHELGWIEGQTVVVEYRWTEGNPDRYQPLAAELVHLKVDVIVVSWSPRDPRRAGSHQHDSYRMCNPGRPGRLGIREEFRPSGWEPHRARFCGIGSVASALGGLLGGRCPRMADYVRGPAATRGAIAAGGG